MKHKFATLKGYTSLIFCLLLAGGSTIPLSSSAKVEVSMTQQQTRKITGTVKDQKGETLLGVNVVEKGTTNGTITDIDGRYSLEIPPNATLIFSYKYVL